MLLIYKQSLPTSNKQDQQTWSAESEEAPLIERHDSHNVSLFLFFFFIDKMTS